MGVALSLLSLTLLSLTLLTGLIAIGAARAGGIVIQIGVLYLL